MSSDANLPAYRTLLTSVDRGVATITLNRPQQRNAIGDGMRDELADAYRTCDRDDSVRVIVLTGTPPAFSAGADLGGGDQTFAEPGAGFSAAGIDVPAWSLSKPVIAAVNGHAIGLGLTLAMQCDIRFFATDARYGVVQVRRGVVGDAYSHWVLPRLVGIANAAEILLTGATFDGHRAVQLGLGSRCSTPPMCCLPRWKWRTTSRRTPRRCRWPPASACCGIRSTWTARPSATVRPKSTCT